MIEMLQSFVEGFFLVFAWKTFSLMIVGITVGFAVGILPGLGGPVTLAGVYCGSAPYFIPICQKSFDLMGLEE